MGDGRWSSIPEEDLSEQDLSTTEDEGEGASSSGNTAGAGKGKGPAAPPRAIRGSKSGAGTGGNAMGKGAKRHATAPKKPAPIEEAGSSAGQAFAAEKSSRPAGQGKPAGPLVAASDEESLSEESDGDNAPLPAAGAARQVCRLTWGCCDFVFGMRNDIQYMEIIMYYMSIVM